MPLKDYSPEYQRMYQRHYRAQQKYLEQKARLEAQLEPSTGMKAEEVVRLSEIEWRLAEIEWLMTTDDYDFTEVTDKSSTLLRDIDTERERDDKTLEYRRRLDAFTVKSLESFVETVKKLTAKNTL